MFRMNGRIVVTTGAIMALAGSLALAQQGSNTKPATPAAGAKQAQDAAHKGEQKMDLPPGMTEADMKACMEAGTPGPMHAHLAKGLGVWTGKTTMWMTPGAEPQHSECISTVTSVMDGRFIKCEMNGDMPGMGPFQGFGLFGYDNVSQKFQSTWIANCGTGMMQGTGELSSDGKTMTWTYNFHCPITKKPTVMREVETITGADTKKLETFGPDPKTGKEYKMMEIAFTRKPGSAPTPSASVNPDHHAK